MRTTLNIDQKLLEEVKVLSGAKTKTEAVQLALQEFIALKKRQKLFNWMQNQKNFDLTLEDLEKMRGG
jgi:Arc/MetJ family transcription regulator